MKGLHPVFILFVIFVLGPWQALGADELKITKGPYLQNVTPISAVVMWETSAPSSSLVEYGASSNYTHRATGADNVTIHEVHLLGLAPINPFHYRVRSGEVASDDYRFRTAPGRNAPCRFAVFGDSRTQPDICRRIGEGVRAQKPDFVLHTGDMVADGTKYEQWSPMLFDPLKALIAAAPFFPALGNHERNSEWYTKFFSLPGDNKRWYSFDWGNAHFVALNSCGDQTEWNADSEQTQWLDRDLEASRAKWKFVYFHHPLYSSGNHGSSLPHREAWEAIFSKYEVDVVFEGHDHTYERTYRVYEGKRNELLGVTYVVAGGGGAPLYDVTANDWTAFSRKTHNYVIARLEPQRLRLETYDLNDALIDHLTITKDPAEVPTLLQLAEEVTTAERLKAIKGMSDLASSAVLLNAPQFANHPDLGVRRAFAEAINRVGLPHGVPHGLRMLRNADAAIKRDVAQLLGKAADAKTAESALSLLNESDAQTRIGAARALSRAKVPKAKAALLKALADADPLVRYYACLALARIASAGDVASLREQMKDTSPLVRFGIVHSLGEAQFRPAALLLIDALGDTNARVKNTALASLRAITKVDFGLDVAMWKRWWDANGK